MSREAPVTRKGSLLSLPCSLSTPDILEEIIGLMLQFILHFAGDSENREDEVSFKIVNIVYLQNYMNEVKEI